MNHLALELKKMKSFYAYLLVMSAFSSYVLYIAVEKHI